MSLGRIDLGVSGGLPPYLITWSGAASGSVSSATGDYEITNLEAGIYIVRSIEDGNNCIVI